MEPPKKPLVSIPSLLRQMVEPKDYHAFLTLLQRLFYAKYVPDTQSYLVIENSGKTSLLEEYILLCKELRSDLFHVTDMDVSHIKLYPNNRIVLCCSVKGVTQIQDVSEVERYNRLHHEHLPTKVTIVGFGTEAQDNICSIHVKYNETLLETLFIDRAQELKRFLLHI